VAEVLGQQLVFDRSFKQVIADRFARLGQMTPNISSRRTLRARRGGSPSQRHAPGLGSSRVARCWWCSPARPRAPARSSPNRCCAPRRLGSSARARPTAAPAPPAWASPRSRPAAAHLRPAGAALSVASVRTSARRRAPQLARRSSRPKNCRPSADECAALLRRGFVCYGHDSLSKIVADLFRAQEKTLAVAESCTAVRLANCFTDSLAPPSFPGAIVCYSNDAKMQILDVPGC